MPFLTDFTLPADVAQFLGPTDALLLFKQPKHDSHAQGLKEKQQRKKKFSVKVKNQGWTGRVKEDLGVAFERGGALFIFV